MSALLIRNGLVVNATGREQADVLIGDDGKIAAIGARVAVSGDEVQTIDATGMQLLPGGIDPHVHLAPFVDDFDSGSKAALAGGVTTIGVMCFPEPAESIGAMLSRHADEAATQSRVDAVLHGVLNVHEPPSPEVLASIVEAGQTTCKIFTMLGDFDGEFPRYIELMHRARALGLMAMFHCEDGPVLSESARALTAQGQGDVSHYECSRPVLSEELAVQKVLALCELTGCPVYIVHVSSARALAACARAQRRGLPVHVETRPIYLHLDAMAYGAADGALYVSFPPIRSAADRRALWRGIADGIVHTVGSDHAPLMREKKLECAHCCVQSPRPGMSNLQEMLPVLYSEGVLEGQLTLERFVEITSMNAARLLGVYPQKGVIAVGADADITIWDPRQTMTLRAAEGHSRADFSVYEGWTVTGVPRTTLLRGKVAFDRGQIIARGGSGRVLQRKAVSP